MGESAENKQELGESEKAWLNRKLKEGEEEISQLRWQLEKYKEKNEELLVELNRVMGRKEPSRIKVPESNGVL